MMKQQFGFCLQENNGAEWEDKGCWDWDTLSVGAENSCLYCWNSVFSASGESVGVATTSTQGSRMLEHADIMQWYNL